MIKRIKRCPVCNRDLQIREYYCAECDITIQGRFNQSDLASLTLGQQEFVKTFLISQGNIKEVEKRLGISYPTVKSRLAEIVRSLEASDEHDEGLCELFDEIEQGKITVEEAVAKIKKKRE